MSDARKPSEKPLVRVTQKMFKAFADEANKQRQPFYQAMYHEVGLDPQLTAFQHAINAMIAVALDGEDGGGLIVAAPELLEVAQGALAEDTLEYLPPEYVAKARAAIAKAIGLQP